MPSLASTIAPLAALLLVSAGPPPLPTPLSRFAERQLASPRVAAAWAEQGAALARAFEEAGASWPPKKLFLRAFKLEGELELWAPARAEPPAGGRRAGPEAPWVLVERVPLCASSGRLGPKRREGDLQVPEGFYRIDRFNPRSRFHLSLGLDYPNAADRHHTEGGSPGGDIFIHGGCVTIGCLPLGDAAAGRVYLAAVLARSAGARAMPVHVFPCRLHTDACRRGLAERARHSPELGRFWAGLGPGYARFEARRRPPRVHARSDGTYRLSGR